MPPILEVSGLSYSYHTISGETKALSDISFQVETGEFIAIVGPSGCGKSTLLSLISGLLPPEEGSILINGVQLSKSQCGKEPVCAQDTFCAEAVQAAKKAGKKQDPAAMRVFIPLEQ